MSSRRTTATLLLSVVQVGQDFKKGFWVKDMAYLFSEDLRRRAVREFPFLILDILGPNFQQP